MGKRKDSPLTVLSPNRPRKILQTTPVSGSSTGKENDRKHSLLRSRVSRLKQSSVSTQCHLADEVTEILGYADGRREVASVATEILHDTGAYREFVSAERPLPEQGTEILPGVDECREVASPERPSGEQVREILGDPGDGRGVTPIPHHDFTETAFVPSGRSERRTLPVTYSRRSKSPAFPSGAASVKKEISGSNNVNHRRPPLEVAVGWRNGAPNGNGVHPRVLKPEESLAILEEAYDKLLEKYRRLKTTKDWEEIEATFNEQSRRFVEFSKAADNLVHQLQGEISLLERQLKEHDIDRLKQLEHELIERRNDVVIERSKVLGLEQQLRESQQHISELESRAANMETPGDRVLCCAHGQQNAETSAARGLGGEFLHKLLQRLTQMSVVVDVNSSRLVFTHEETGFSCALEQDERSRLLGGDDAVIFKVISHRSTVHLAADTLPSELVFDLVQAEVFFHKILMPHISKFMHNL